MSVNHPENQSFFQKYSPNASALRAHDLLLMGRKQGKGPAAAHCKIYLDPKVDLRVK